MSVKTTKGAGRGTVGSLGLQLVLILGVIISVFPFYWSFIGATNSSGEIFSVPPNFLPGDEAAQNFRNLQEEIGFARAMGNSLFIALTYTVLGVLISSLAGYAFAKFRFRGRESIFFVLLLAVIVPYQVTLVPLFQIMVFLGWINTFQAIVLPNLALPFGIFLMRQNMTSLPDDLIEAARVDGCGELRIFWNIVLPTMRPALAALAIYMFVFQWNNFMWPLIALRTEEMYTVPVALSSLIGLQRIDYGQLMMGTSLAVIPIMIFFLLLQRQFIAGILSGSVKG
ncbi:MAG: carbohydrate ABC transporter permease [Rubrobacter sp.]